MKSLLFLAGLGIGLSLGHAQGVITLRATLTGYDQVPPNASDYVAFGEFTLDGPSLDYSVFMHNRWIDPTQALIHGPELPGRVAPTLFLLEPLQFIAPLPEEGYSGGVSSAGRLLLTEGQKADLLAGLWYVNLTSPPYPAGELRGQIYVVPEPATWVLLTLGGPVVVWACRRRT